MVKDIQDLQTQVTFRLNISQFVDQQKMLDECAVPCSASLPSLTVLCPLYFHCPTRLRRIQLLEALPSAETEEAEPQPDGAAADSR